MTTTQFQVSTSIAKACQGALGPQQFSEIYPKCQAISTGPGLSHKTFSTVERLPTSALLCPRQLAWLMQPLFAKAALGLDFKSLSPCCPSAGWWPVHHQEDMPRMELSFWERHVLMSMAFFFTHPLTCSKSVFSMSALQPHPYVP